MQKRIDIELAGLPNEELLELYKKIEEHLAYLESNILTVEEESEDEDTAEEENEDESTK